MSEYIWGYISSSFQPFRPLGSLREESALRNPMNIFLKDDFGMEVYVPKHIGFIEVPKVASLRGYSKKYNQQEIKNIRTLWRMRYKENYFRASRKYSKLKKQKNGDT